MTTLTTDQEAKLERIPRHLRGMYRRAVMEHSRASAVWFQCLECVAWSPSEVRACTARGCALYPYRFQGSQGAEDSAGPREDRHETVPESPIADRDGSPYVHGEDRRLQGARVEATAGGGERRA